MQQTGGVINNGTLVSDSAFDMQAGTVNAVLGGTAGLNKSTAGLVTLNAANTYTGVTSVSAGTLALGTASERLANASTLVVSGGSFDLGGFTETVAGVQQTGGVINNGTLVSGSAFDMQAGSASAVLGGAVGFNKSGPGVFMLNAANSYGGATVVSAGTLTLGVSNALPTSTALSVDGPTAVLDINSRSNTVNSVQLADAGSLNGSSGVLSSLSDFDLRSGAASARLAGAVGLTKSSSGDVTLSGLNSYGGATAVTAGRLALGASNVLPDGTSVTVSGATAVLDLATFNDTVAGLSLQSGGTVTGSSGVLTSLAAFDMRSGSASAILAGSQGLNKTTAGLVTLHAANTFTGVTTVDGGTLQLGTASERLANASTLVVRSGNFDLGGLAETVAGVQLLGGTISNGTLTSGTNYDMQAGSVSAVLAGTVGLTKTTAGTVILGGLNTYTGVNTLSQGTLLLGTLGSLDPSSQVDIASGATLEITGNQSVVSLQLAGALVGTGSLTAGTYALDGGRSDVALGGGTLSSAGNSALNNTVGATMVSVTSGSLSMGGPNLLADGATVTVASPATLLINGNDTVTRLNLLGTLAGSGTLTAQQYALDGGTVNVDLGAGALLSAGASRLNTRAAVQTLDVTAGRLQLGSAGRLSAAPAVNIASGAVLAMAGSERFGLLTGGGQLDLAAGTLSTGSGGSSSFAGVIIGNGGLVKEGGSDFTLAGANTFTGDTHVQAGRLLLPAADRLSDASAVSVASGASLSLAGTETVRSLQLAGALTGAGTLTAASYALNSGTASAGLGRGALSSTGVSTLSGPAALDQIAVQNGTLALDISARLLATPVVVVEAGSRLTLAGDQTLGSLAGAGTVVLDSSTLTTGVAGSSVFAGVMEGTGGLSKQGASTLTLSGVNTYSGATRVLAGTLVLAGNERIADVSSMTVDSAATLQLGGSERVSRLDLQGTLGGAGLLTAAAYALNNGRMLAGADLGAGSLTSIGNSALAGRSAADTLSVNSGRLTLASSGLLSNPDAQLTVATGAALTLTGAAQVNHLRLLGTLDGSGVMTAATYLVEGGTAIADLGAGALTSSGGSLLSGRSAAGTVAVTGGTLALGGPDRLAANSVVNLAAGAGLALQGSNTIGSLSGQGAVALGSFTLSTGSAGTTTYGGAMSGAGGLVKRGTATTFSLTGANTYSGPTTVAEGSLVIGDGATAGSVATSNFVVDGVLRSARSDNVVFAQPISGAGSLEQMGTNPTSRLTLQNNNKTYTGATLVSKGELASAAAENLSDFSDVRVSAGASLILAGAETVKSVDADGGVSIDSRLATTGTMALKGAIVASGAALVPSGTGVSLAGGKIDAVNAGNLWGPNALSVNASGALTLSSGKDGAGNFRDLTLGSFNAAGGGRVDAGAVAFTGLTTIAGGTLVIDANKLASFVPDVALAGKRVPGERQIAFAADVVTQTAGSRIDVAAGGQLSIVASQGGSINLSSVSNNFGGGLALLSGAANSPWAINEKDGPAGNTAIKYSVQSHIQVVGTQVVVAGAGFEADVVAIKADKLSTPAGAVIVARLPFDNLVGTTNSLPGLSFFLTDPAFLTAGSFGLGGSEISINVGSKAFGNRSALLVDSGYVTVLPLGGAKGSTALFLKGPPVAGTYGFFYDGAGVQSEVPLFYNGVTAVTPQVSGSISSTLSVSESARKERFEEAVRTENVAVRLRAGVIAEVGPGTPATTSSGPLDRMRPEACPPASSGLACAP